MTKIQRQLIFVFFLTVFLVATPLILMRTYGYRYNWQKRSLEKTGILRVESVPTGAKVFLGGKLQTDATPAIVTRLLPEDYDVRLEKAGYYPWEKVLPVESGMTAFAVDVRLIQDALPALETPGNIKAADVDRNGDAALLSAGDLWTDLVLRDAQGSTHTLGRFAMNAVDSPSLAWSPDGSGVLLRARNAAGKEFLNFFPRTATADSASGGVAIAGLRSARWSPAGTKLLVTTSSGYYETDASLGTLKPVAIAADARDAVMKGTSHYLLRSDSARSQIVKYSSLFRSNPVTVAELASGYSEFVEAGGPLLIVRDPSDGSALAIDPNTGETLASFKCTGAIWRGTDADGELLHYDDYEISIWRRAAPDSPETVTRVSTPIRGVAWTKDGHYITFGTANAITAIEVDARGERNVYDLARFPKIGEFWINADSTELRFTGEIGIQSGMFKKDL